MFKFFETFSVLFGGFSPMLFPSIYFCLFLLWWFFRTFEKKSSTKTWNNRPSSTQPAFPLTRHPYMPTGLLAEVFAWTGLSKVRPDIPKPHRTVSPWPSFVKDIHRDPISRKLCSFNPCAQYKKNGQFCLRFRGVSLDITQTRTKIMRP